MLNTYPHSKFTKAFTLIELMVVVAIVAILASFGIPAYQDYIRKTRVAEALQLIEPIKLKIVENAYAGLPFDSGVVLPTLTPYLSSIVLHLDAGWLRLSFNPAKFNGNSYYMDIVPKDLSNSATGGYLVGTTIDSQMPLGSITWGCRSAGTTYYTASTMPAKYVPQVCTGNPYW